MYVIFHKDTTIFASYNGKDRWTREQDAKSALTRLKKKQEAAVARYAAKLPEYSREHQRAIESLEDMKNLVISTFEDHAKIEKTETRYGAGPAHGKVYENVKVNVGWTTGPWSETYWSS